MRPELFGALVFIVSFAVQDLLHRTVPLKPALVFAAAGIILAILHPRGSFVSYALSLLPGLFVFASCCVSRGGIGAGDGLAVTILGLFLSLPEVLLVLMSGFLLAAVFAAFLFIRKRCSSAAFPFLPFLVPGVLYVLLR